MSQEPPTVNAGEPHEHESATATVGSEGGAYEGEAPHELAASTDAATDSDLEKTVVADLSAEAAPMVAVPADAVADQREDQHAATENAAAERAPAEPEDDSLAAILLEAGAKPPEHAADRAAAKEVDRSIGSRTLMGVGMEGFDLAGFRASQAAAAQGGALGATEGLQSAAAEHGDPLAQETRLGGDENTPAVLVESKLTTEPHGDEPGRTTSLLDEVAQALDAQAAEYRDRARGRLPGMPGSGPIATPNRSPSAGAEAEFEDPEEAQSSSFTPAIISVVEGEAEVAVQTDDLTEKVPSGPTPSLLIPPPGLTATAKATEARPTDSRPTLKMPPVPGTPTPPAGQLVGPPPGAGPRPATPASGLPSLPLTTSGRVRLPTPGPVAPGLPSPSGRLTLPPGTMSPFAIPRPGGDLTDTMPATPMSIESSRRNTGGVAVSRGSGRVSVRGNARVTEPVIHMNPSSVAALLKAHVKLATVSLAGLIALTFAGGLFVGMLVWRGQGRSESPAVARTAAPNGVVSGVAELPAGAALGQRAAAEGAAAAPAHNGATAAAVGAAGALGVNAKMGSEGAGATVPAATPASAAKEPVVAPLPTVVPQPAEAAATTGALAARKAPARAVMRPRRPTPVAAGAAAPGEAPPGATPVAGGAPAAAKTAVTVKTASLRPASLTTAKQPMAANGAAKATPKSKGKAAWHDPFAD